MCSIENSTIRTPESDERHVADGLGQLEVGNLVVHDRLAEDPAVVGHGSAEQQDQHVDHELDLVAHAIRQQHQQRFHADVPGIAHARRRRRSG